jgi:hypothetical protein
MSVLSVISSIRIIRYRILSGMGSLLGLLDEVNGLIWKQGYFGEMLEL